MNKKEWGPKQKALHEVSRRLSNILTDRNREIQDHATILKRLELNEQKLNAALRMLNGDEGYVRLSQHAPYMPQSGFTAFEEIVDKIDGFMFDVSLEELKPFFGTVVFKVDNKGMMNVIDRMVDSSD